MRTANNLLVAYAANSLWLLPLLVLTAEIIGRLMGRTRGKLLYCLWLICLGFALIIPAMSFFNLSRGESPAVMFSASVPAGGSHRNFTDETILGNQTPQLKLSQIPGMVLNGVACLYMCSILFALGRLGLGLWRTRSLVRSSFPARLSNSMQRTWEDSVQKFGATNARLLSTASLSSPATLSWPGPLVLLPADLENEEPDEMAAAFCHELAHVRRNDFAWNVATELLGVVLFYHPAFHWIRRRIQETREMTCDDMAAEALSGRQVYARNLLNLTQKMLAAAATPQPSCALGVFEGEVLERRIMNLLEKRSPHHRVRAFASVVLGCCLVAVACSLSSNFGLKPVSAQSATLSSQPPAGWFLAGSKPAQYQSGVDQEAVENGQPSAFLKSAEPSPEGFGTLMQTIRATEYAGRRIRLRTWVRSQDVADWAGVWMRVDKEQTMVAFDNMQSRPIKGTQPWKTCDVVLDVPKDATSISFGILLSGAGEVWMNNIAFAAVGEEIPVTSATSGSAKLPSQPVNLEFNK